MSFLPRSVLYFSLAIVASIWIHGCWSVVNHSIDKYPLEVKPKSNPGLFLFPSTPNLLPQQSFQKNLSYSTDQE